MKRILNNGISLMVVVIVLFLIIPLPTQLLDVMLVINIALSIIILLITMNIKETLEFSIYPSLLLITALFRLGLNVSTTRQILWHGYAGDVIRAFGDLITSGNVIIGFIIFFIIVMVQFIVITKGAERVAEVAARFTLDAMPGKQMAIDADLNAGLITEQDARMRREKIQREADFYGAMDGATKIVKGDAVMSIIITFINLIGGIIIGMVQGGMEINEVLTRYSTATIGEGLVSQLPALMISTATGMIVTRSVSEGSLNTDVIKQFTAQPRAIIIAGAALIFLALMPNTPHFALCVVAAILIVFGFVLNRQMKNRKAQEEARDYVAVILDWKMPGKSGIEAAREIRDIVADDVPIIILSAYDWSSIEQEARATGVDAFISKPLFRSRLVHVMQELLTDYEEDVFNEQKALEQCDCSGRRILLTEDNNLAAAIAEDIIGMTGAEVERAENGRESFEMLKGHEPGYYDLVFMDIQMPVMNGYEATQAIRGAAAERPDLAELPIIALSADAFNEDIQRARAAGMNAHMSKPMEIEALIKTLKEWLS